MSDNTVKHTDELIIRGNQVYSREYFESPLGNIEKLLDEACNPKTHKILNLMFPSVLRNSWCIGHYFAETPKGFIFVITEIEYFPFPDSHVISTGTEYTLAPYPAAACAEVDFENGLRNTMGHCPKWYPPKNARFFLLTSPQSYDEPHFFMIHSDYEEPLVPRIPNVFNTGRICTGESYFPSIEREETVFDKTRAALDNIRNAPANKDLRENDQLFIKWKKNDEGILKPVDVAWMESYSYNATDERILEFTKTIRP
jgi:hypothetical protein